MQCVLIPGGYAWGLYQRLYPGALHFCPLPPCLFQHTSSDHQVVTAGGGAANLKWIEMRAKAIGVPVVAAEQGVEQA